MMKKVYKSLLCVALPLATVGTLASVSSVTAQSITPDATLGNESSVVNTNVDVGKGIPSDRIDGGATRGNNLFHSFSNFNVDAGRGAFFSNPTGIENIVSRVTGSNISNILGTLGVLGNANLFFANPNGIVFGPNARLDVSGSFFATTSDSFTFGNGFEFSASNPQAPPLLTVNIPIGLRFRDNPGSITNESVAANTDNTPVGLQVLPGRTLALVGGDVNFEGGRVTAPGARVEIGGLSTEGVVGINDDLSLSFPEGVARADVLFNNAARVDVRGVDRGSIIINAKDLNILGGSRLDAGIFPNSGSQGAQAGDIVINAENKLTIQGENTSSAIANVVGENAQGNAGNVLINANSLEGKGLFAIGSSTFAQGDAGKVTITATEKVSFKGSQQFSGSGIASAVAPLAVGDAKDVTINTPSLSLSNFSQITTSTSGQGNAANIQINASKSVSVNSGSLLQATSFSSGNAGKIIIEAEGADVSFDGVGTAASTSVAGRSEILGVQVIGTGQGDDIKIKARNLSVTNGAQLSTSTSGEVGTSGLLPNAGNIQINVSDNIFLNEGSRIRSETFGFGNAGSVTIGGINGNLPKISFDGTNGTLSSGIFTTVERVTPEPTEPRIGGDINITAQSLELKDGAQINSSTFGVGNAGNISIDVREGVFLQGFQDEFSSGIFSDVGSISRFARGDAGSIDIKAGNLSVTNGARISSSTFDIGNAGNINIDVREGVFLQGNNDILTAIRSNVENFGNGKGGNIKIKATNLSLLDGADIQTAVRGRSSDGNPAGIGNAGNVQINVSGDIILNKGSQIRSDTFGFGNAGSVTIDGINGDLPDISFDGTGVFGGRTFDSGIFTTVGRVTPEPAESRIGGDINITAQSLELTNGAAIDSSTSGKGNAGRVNIQVENGDLTLDNSSNIFSNVESGAIGDAGNIDVEIKTGNLFITKGSQIQSIVRGANGNLSAGEGNTGKITIKIDNGNLNLSDIGDNGLPNLISTSYFGANSNSDVVTKQGAGDIEITATGLSMTDGARLLSVTAGTRNAGDIQINVSGDIKLNEGSQIRSDTFGFGNAGSVTIGGINGNLPKISFDGTNGTLSSGIFTTVERVTPEPTEPRIGGDINITAQSLELKDGAQLDSSTSGKGNAGNISITVDDSINLANTGTIQSRVGTGAEGIGGNINIVARSLTLTGGSEIIVSTFGKGKAGNIQIEASEFVTFFGVAPFPELEDGRAGGFSSGLFVNTEQGAEGEGGTITVTTPKLQILDGAVINARSRSSFRGGDITVNADILELTGGGQILSTAFSEGDAGNIIINVVDRITISGSDPTFSDRFNQVSQKFGEDQALFTIDPVSAESGIFATTIKGSTGNGGDIRIDPKILEISDGAKISADSEGTGKPGNISIQAGLLLLRRGAGISTDSTQDNDGGNITINTDVLVAFPEENSDISANAVEGTGGNVDITAQAIFGIVPRNRSTGLSDITASSEFGISGTVTINNPEIDPNNGLIELPETVVDANKQIAQNPCKQGVGSEFVATGRGGLPPNPTQDLTSSAVRVGLATPVTSNTTNTIAVQPKSTPTVKKIVPAQGWIFNSKGQVVLTAYNPNEIGVQRTAHKGLCRAK